jgi:hypothetical protein
MAVVCHVPLNHTVELHTTTLRTFGTEMVEGLAFALLFCVLCMALVFLSGVALL